MSKLFRDRELRIRVAKTTQPGTAPTKTDEPIVDIQQIAQIAKDVTKHVAVAVGAVIVLSGLVGTIREVTVKKTKSADDQ